MSATNTLPLSSHRDIAVALMYHIMYDNGWVNRLEPEWFNPKWIKRITPIAGAFFDRHPHLLNDDELESMTCGEYDENQEKYGQLEGFAELHAVLDEYFESGGN